MPWGVRTAALVALAATTAALGYVLGPLGIFAAAVALVLVVAGLFTGRPWLPVRTGRLTYAAVAGGQLVVFAAIVTGALADRSAVPVHVPHHGAWQLWTAHLSLQGIFLAAFVAGRAASRRYQRLLDDIAASARDADRQDALLAEARADYARAVEIARRGAVAPAGPRAIGRGATADDPSSVTIEQASAVTIDERTMPPAAPAAPDAAPPPAAEETWSDPSRVLAWQDAYNAKMGHLDAVAIGLCAIGTVLLWLLALDPLARAAAWLSLLGIVAAFGVRRWLVRRDPSAAAYGPWIAIAAVVIGAVYAWGLHSGFGAVPATMLFAGGLFRAPRARSRDRLVVLAVIVATHGLVFALIAGGVLRDAGNVPVFAAGCPGWTAYAVHAQLQATFLIAFFAGTLIDRRFADAFRRADAAHHDVLRRQAMLRETRAEIDEALRQAGGGMFTGTEVGGYAVGRLLGRGGMGEVYEATDVAGARVALKLLRGDRAGDPASLARFTAEADVLTHVDSPFVARVLEVGNGAGELPFIAMAYVEGRSLAALLRQRERLAITAVASLVRDVARGLEHVHEAGFVHQDIKPSNILLTEEVEMGSRWCIVDFGVARFGGGASPDGIAGTSQFMAPEQALGGEVDARADLYSLCLVVYRALTGRPAFPGTDRLALAAAARRGPPDPRAFAPVGDDVLLALRIGLAADPADRWPTAFDLRVAFERAFIGDLPDEYRSRARRLG